MMVACPSRRGRIGLLPLLLVLVPAAAGGSPAATRTSSRTALGPSAPEPDSARFEALERNVERLEAALLQDASGEDPHEARLSFYGFFETGIQRTWTKEGGLITGVQQTPASSFILGNLHLYLDARPSPQWRALFELRLTTSHGTFDSTSASGLVLLNTSERRINDPGIGTGAVQLRSSLVLERAQIEYHHDDWLNLRVGLWLTPWGIWNVDHGSPTLIPLILPYFISFQFLPTHQVGLGLYGRFDIADWALEYHLAASNGRLAGPSTARDARWPSFDITDDKMVSGRLVLREPRHARLALGLSGYWGTTSRDERRVVAINPVRIENQVGVELEELGFGADIAWDVSVVRLRLEFIHTRFRYPDKRPLSALYPQNFEADSSQTGGYLLVSVPLELGGLHVEPYVYGELLWMPVTIAPDDMVSVLSAGVNLVFTDAVLLKTQYGFGAFFDAADGGLSYSAPESFHMLSSRLVVSF